jgi:homoisocitrate dehydrogenase
MPDLCVIPGDGIGREVIPPAVAVLAGGHPRPERSTGRGGWETFQRQGSPFPGHAGDRARLPRRPVRGGVRRRGGWLATAAPSLTLRQELDCTPTCAPCALPPRLAPPGVDLFVVRENTEGLYAGASAWKATWPFRAGHHPPRFAAIGRRRPS